MSRGARAIVVVLLTVPFVPSIAGQENWYWVEYNGTQYPEFEDRASRFDHIAAADVDGDGTLDAHNFSLGTEEWTDVADPAVTNAAVETASNVLGVTRTEMVAQLDMLLSEYPQYASLWEEARLKINSGDYTGAQGTLTNTPADVIFYCSTNRVNWVLAVPLPLDCVANSPPFPAGTADVYVVTSIFSVGLYDGELETLTLTGRTVPAGTVSGNSRVIFGVGYEPYSIETGARYDEVSAGAASSFLNIADTGDELNVDLELTHLTGASEGYYAGSIQLFKEFDDIDRLFLSFGKLRDRGILTFSLELQSPTTQLGGGWVSADIAGGRSTRVDITDGYAFLDFMGIYFPFLGEDANRVEAKVWEFPATFTADFWFENGNTAQGDKHLLELRASEDLFETEINLNFYRNGLRVVAADFVGIPTVARARVDIDLVAANIVKSIDLRRVAESGGQGYFRTAVADFFGLLPIVDLDFNDFDRAYLFFSADDPWDSDSDAMAFIGINFAKCNTSSATTGDITGIQFIKGFENIKYRPISCPGGNPFLYRATTNFINPPDESIIFEIDEDDPHWEMDTLWFNLWWWAIPDGSTACPLKEEGLCA